MSETMEPTAVHLAHFPTEIGRLWILRSWIGTALTVTLASNLVPVWLGQQWGLGRRLIATALLLSSAIFVFLLAYWRVLEAPVLG